jgi:CheY-specific phosphatase CheX
VNDLYEPLIEAFVKATVMVLGTSCKEVNVDYRRSDSRLQCSEEDVIGMMGMTGVAGLTSMVAFPTPLAATIVSLMCGYDEDELSREDIDDGISEFLNMVCGNAKAWLNRDGYNLELSVPTVIRAVDYQIAHHRDVYTMGVHFRILGSGFELRLSAKELVPRSVAGR